MHRVWFVVLAGCAAMGINWLARSSAADESSVNYQRDIWPVLEQTCLRCHNEKKKNGGLDMTTRAKMVKGGFSGPAFVPGKADKSLMLELIEFNEMPPKKEKPRVSKEQFQKFRAWVAAGAPVPTEPAK